MYSKKYDDSEEELKRFETFQRKVENSKKNNPDVDIGLMSLMTFPILFGKRHMRRQDYTWPCPRPGHIGVGRRQYFPWPGLIGVGRK